MIRMEARASPQDGLGWCSLGPPVHFEIAHEFDIPLDALSLAVLSPRLAETMAERLADRVRIEQAEHQLEDRRLRRRWVCRANVHVPAFVRKHVTPEMMAWEERSTYDIARHTSEWVVAPHANPSFRSYFSATGSSVLEELESGRTRRTVSADMDLRIPMFRSVVEKLIVSEVRKMFDAEAEALKDLATLV